MSDLHPLIRQLQRDPTAADFGALLAAVEALPQSDVALPELGSTLAAVMALLGEVEPGEGPILRSQRSGEPLSYEGLRSLVARLGARAGVVDVHPYRFRHTFGRWLYSSDRFSGLEAMILMRHRSLSAHDRYVRHVAQQRAAERFRQLEEGW